MPAVLELPNGTDFVITRAREDAKFFAYSFAAQEFLNQTIGPHQSKNWSEGVELPHDYIFPLYRVWAKRRFQVFVVLGTKYFD